MPHFSALLQPSPIEPAIHHGKILAAVINFEIIHTRRQSIFEKGDVFLAPIQMKKNRPGVLLWVLGEITDRDKLSALLFAETSTLGIRSYPVARVALRRESRAVVTPYGSVRVKLAYGPDGRVNLAPEYEDCKRLAREKDIPLKRVYEAAIQSARES